MTAKDEAQFRRAGTVQMRYLDRFWILGNLKNVSFAIAALLMTGPVRVAAEIIPLQSDHGTNKVAVRVNDAIVLPFIIDTGATSVVLTADIVSTLIKSGTITSSDFIGKGTSVLADGSEIPSVSFLLRELKVGNYAVRNVVASVSSGKGDLLLGQSLLSRLPPWTIDYQQHKLVVRDASNNQQMPDALARIPAEPATSSRFPQTSVNAVPVEVSTMPFDGEYWGELRLTKVIGTCGQDKPGNLRSVSIENGDIRFVYNSTRRAILAGHVDQDGTFSASGQGIGQSLTQMVGRVDGRALVASTQNQACHYTFSGTRHQ